MILIGLRHNGLLPVFAQADRELEQHESGEDGDQGEHHHGVGAVRVYDRAAREIADDPAEARGHTAEDGLRVHGVPASG